MPDSATTVAGTAVSIDVLANDWDVDGDNLKVASTTQGSNGSVTILRNQQVQYFPYRGFTGTDTFTYVADDSNGGTAVGVVTVIVAP